MRTVCLSATRSKEVAGPFRLGEDPVSLRLSVRVRGGDLRGLSAIYTVVVGLYKILGDLNVRSYRHSVDRQGLSFYLEVGESRAAVRAYLMGLKDYHFLGPSWQLALIEGTRLLPVWGQAGQVRPMTGEELDQLVQTHLRMGSRPLRFSRYFLYAALAPYTRLRGYGCALMDREDARGEDDFYWILQGLEMLTRSLASTDFSGLDHLEALRSRGRLLENALSDLGGRTGLLKGVLFQTLLFACLYQKKVAGAEWVEALRALCQGLEKDFDGPACSPGLEAHQDYGVGGLRTLALEGFRPLFDSALPFYTMRKSLDDLSLFLLTQTVDTTTLTGLSLEAYATLQQLADQALFPGNQDREQFNAFFYENGLVTRGISDLITATLLLQLILEEEKDQ